MQNHDAVTTAARPGQKRVIVTFPATCEVLAPLQSMCDVEVLPAGKSLREYTAGGHPAQGIVCLLTQEIDSTLLGQLPCLEFVASVSVGVDHIDVAAMTLGGIAVGHTPGVLVDATADTAFALLLAAARRIPEADRFVRGGRWQPEQPWSPDFFLGKHVAGATLGIVGLGAIGQAVARRAQAFGMSVLGWTPSARPVAGVTPASLDELLATSDYVSVHVARTQETLGLLGEREIALMKAGSVLVNSARGGIVDERALYEALRDGHLFAAGIDVFAVEPVEPGNPLLSLDNVVLTPHIGSATPETRADMLKLALANTAAALRGERMPHCVNPEVYRASD